MCDCNIRAYQLVEQRRLEFTKTYSLIGPFERLFDCLPQIIKLEKNYINSLNLKK